MTFTSPCGIASRVALNPAGASGNATMPFGSAGWVAAGLAGSSAATTALEYINTEASASAPTARALCFRKSRRLNRLGRLDIAAPSWKRGETNRQRRGTRAGIAAGGRENDSWDLIRINVRLKRSRGLKAKSEPGKGQKTRRQSCDYGIRREAAGL